MTIVSPPLHQLTARECLELMAQDRLTATALVEACLARIRERDADVRAWLVLSDAARAEAARLDALPKAARGRLHGLPIGIKDVFDTRDLPTTYNSPLYAGFQPAADAAAVDLLRAEGAIILGKTDTTEFAACGRDAATANPHDLSRTPGGSSAGSAAAVADFHVPLALATQTGGSTIRPASFCGIFGYKPSAGLVSREGMKIYAISLDTVGWYARSIDDIRLLQEVFGITERFREDPAPDAPLRIAVTETPYHSRLAPESLVALEQAERHLRLAGHHVERVDLPDGFERLDTGHRTILHREGAAAFRNLARRHGKALHDDFHHRVDNRDKRSLADLKKAQDDAAQARMAFDAFASEFDLIIAPSAPGFAPAGRKPGDPVFNAFWTLLQVPCLNMPLRLAGETLPIGITLTAPRYDDVRLLALAERLSSTLTGAPLAG